MPTFTFDGFTLGSPVAVSATQGADSATNSVSGWGQGAMGSVNIQVTAPPLLMAPAPVWFEATDLDGFNVDDTLEDGVYDRSFHEVTYIWKVQNTPLPAYARLENAPLAWSMETPSSNHAYGKKVAFRFPVAGDYTVELRCVDNDGELKAQATTSFTVDPVSFSAANTIVASQSGFSGAPAATTQVTSISELNAAIQSRNNPTRVTFKPGEVWDPVNIEPGGGNLAYIDTWVENQKVTLRPWQISWAVEAIWMNDDPTQRNQLTIRDIIFESDWDPTTETGDYGRGAVNFGAASAAAIYMIHNCDFNGQDVVSLTLGSNSSGNRLMIADCAWDGWRGYGIYSDRNPQGFYALLGNKITQNPQALCGGPKTGMRNDHGCGRFVLQSHMYIACNDFFTTSGWSGNPPPANAALRLHTSVDPASSTIMERNVLEGGYTQIKCDGQNDLQTERGGNHLFERNILIGTARSLAFTHFGYGGTTFRNNLLYMPDVPLFESFVGEFMSINPDGPNDGTNDQPFAVFNNTYITPETDVRTQIAGNFGYFSEAYNENNLYYGPNQNPPALDGGSVDLATALTGVTPRFQQVQYNYRLLTGNVGSVPNNGTLSIPYSSIDRSTGFTRSGFNSGSTAPTDQSYWQAAEAAGDNLHMIRVRVDGQVRLLWASRGEFSVSYADPSNVVITNTTGGTWSDNYDLHLDRRSYLDTDLPADLSYQSPAILPTCTPLSAPSGQTTNGRLAYDDLFLKVRTQPVSPGAIEF